MVNRHPSHAAPMPDPSMDDVLEELDTLLTQVILLQRNHVSKVCTRCKDVCCKRVQFLFDEKDVIYQKLHGRAPVQRRRGKNTKGCRFLTRRGCSLESKARPFTCHRYLCPELRDTIAADDPELPDLLEQKFVALDGLRSQLWRIYLQYKPYEPPDKESNN